MLVEVLLLILVLLLTGVFGVALGVHLQAAKTGTDCGCGKKGLAQGREGMIISRLAKLEQTVFGAVGTPARTHAEKEPVE